MADAGTFKDSSRYRLGLLLAAARKFVAAFDEGASLDQKVFRSNEAA